MARKTAADGQKASALSRTLRGMFKSLEARPVPDRLRSVVDQLDDGAAGKLKKSGSR
jgi:hypothetical protein